MTRAFDKIMAGWTMRALPEGGPQGFALHEVEAADPSRVAGVHRPGGRGNTPVIGYSRAPHGARAGRDAGAQGGRDRGGAITGLGRAAERRSYANASIRRSASRISSSDWSIETRA